MKVKLVQTMKQVKTGAYNPDGSPQFRQEPVGEIIDALRSWQHKGKVYPVRGGYLEVQGDNIAAMVRHFGGRFIEIPEKDFAEAVAKWAKDNEKHAQVANALPKTSATGKVGAPAASPAPAQ